MAAELNSTKLGEEDSSAHYKICTVQLLTFKGQSYLARQAHRVFLPMSRGQAHQGRRLSYSFTVKMAANTLLISRTDVFMLKSCLWHTFKKNLE